MSRRVEKVGLREFNRHPARYVDRAYLLNLTIYVVAPGGAVKVVLRGYAADTSLRLRAAREDARGTSEG